MRDDDNRTGAILCHRNLGANRRNKICLHAAFSAILPLRRIAANSSENRGYFSRYSEIDARRKIGFTPPPTRTGAAAAPAATMDAAARNPGLRNPGRY